MPDPSESETITGIPKTNPSKKRHNGKRRGPNYNQIHSKPLPLETHPLPAFHPTNPISLLRLAYTYLYQLLAPPSSHPTELYTGHWSAELRSVHVTDPRHARALWEMGFFGKGTLSRSEPSWLDREKARLKAEHAGGGGTAEEATNARREKRKLFKLERARAEAEKIERQRLVEEGKLDSSALEITSNDIVSTTDATASKDVIKSQPFGTPTVKHIAYPLEEEEFDVENQECLQLTMQEAFFLAYGLGVLAVHEYGEAGGLLSNADLVSVFTRSSFFPPCPHSYRFSPDDPFMVNYVVYHHFRSLGWVVRPGVKFSVDYLLYLRGPVFSHAEFAVIIMPTYSDHHWNTAEGKSQRRVKENEQKDWWWLHCVNRVQSQVLKNLVLVYVDIPPPSASEEPSVYEIGELLKGYKVREFALKRWLANRSRD